MTLAGRERPIGGVGTREDDVLTMPFTALGTAQCLTGDRGLIDRGRTATTRGRRRRGDSTGRLAVLGIIASTVLLVIATFSVALGNEGGEEVLKARVSYLTHDPIAIYTDAGFTPENGTTDGTGTAEDPYIIENWEIDATDGIGILMLATSAHYVIRNVHVYGAGSHGMYLWSSSNGTVEGCLLDSGTVGMLAMGVSGCNITGNTITNQEIGIELFGGRWANITENTMLNNNVSSLFVYYSDNSSISSNICSNSNMSGAVFAESGNMWIGNNVFSNNGYYGILTNDTHDMVIEGNDVTSDHLYGVYLGNSTDIRVFHNNFVGNDVQAVQDNCTNIAWDDGYPSGGNYWSDYAGDDDHSGIDQDVPGADGIGDTPYMFDVGGVDRYPWMTPGEVIIPEFTALLVPLLATSSIICVMFRSERHRRRQ